MTECHVDSLRDGFCGQNDIVQACQRVVCDTQPQSGAAGAGGGNAFAPNVLGVGDIFAHVFASGKCLRPEVLGTDPSARCLMGLLAAPVAAWERAFASAGSTSQKGIVYCGRARDEYAFCFALGACPAE
eukprot:m.67657 g.67657  ORF g.67657 m.67657 type:complete len:129 (+) comp15972_c0_seq21:1039-1425(+)